jgi:hypothetical protein
MWHLHRSPSNEKEDRPMKCTTLVLAALALLLGSVGQARAGYITLYNNLSSTNSGGASVSAVGPLADSFSTGGAAVNLSDVKVLIGLPPFGIPPTGSITVTLNSDGSIPPGGTLTTPGAVLTTIGTLNDSSLSNTLTAVDFSTSFSLAANTRYWIEISSSNSSNAFWGYAADASDVGVANEHFANNGGAFPNSEGPYQMEVTAQTAATGVPEPSTLTLLSLGSLGLIGYGWRRRNRAST